MKCEIKIPESGKIDIHGVERKYEVRLNKLETDKNILPRNRDLILKFLRDAQLGKTIKQGEKKKIGKSRCLKYISFLIMISGWLNKDFDKVEEKDMEKLILDLESDKLRRKGGEKYGEVTKVDFKKIIKKFYKWLLGNNEHYPDIVSWFDTSLEERDIPALNRKEVEKMIECTPKIMNKAVIMVLFDSGQRIEELLNNRLKHITKKEDYYMVRVEYSKTKPRTISVPLCTKYLDDWLAIHPYKDKPEAQLFPVTYGQVTMMLRRLGKRVLGKSVYPHLLRHSSATYYANIEKTILDFVKGMVGLLVAGWLSGILTGLELTKKK